MRPPISSIHKSVIMGPRSPASVLAFRAWQRRHTLQSWTVSLSSAIFGSFYVLSYVWGSQTATEILWVNKLEFCATKNLDAALTQLSLPEGFEGALDTRLSYLVMRSCFSLRYVTADHASRRSYTRLSDSFSKSSESLVQL